MYMYKFSVSKVLVLKAYSLIDQAHDLINLSFSVNIPYLSFFITSYQKILCIWLRSSDFLKVCSEETMTEILARYLRYNAHAASYTWKYDGRNLDMDKTLEDNGIPDEDEEFYKLSMNDDTFLQAIHLYFNDDLTEA